jgi:hypothetical protein
MGSGLERSAKTPDSQTRADARAKLTESAQAALSTAGSPKPESGAKPAPSAKPLPEAKSNTSVHPESRHESRAEPGAKSGHPSHLLKNLEISGIGIAATGLVVAGLRYKPLASLAESLLKSGSEDSGALSKLVSKYPELSLGDLITRTTDNLNQGCLNRETFDHLVGSVVPADRELAGSIAKLSLPNASDFTLMHSLRDMGSQLETSGIKLHELQELTSANPASPGQTTAYLFRKANGIRLGIHNLGAIDAPTSGAVASTKPILLFDHISEFSPEQIEHLKKAAQSGRQIFLMDANNFHTGINFTDFAKGTAESKLQTLVEQAKALAPEAPDAVANAATPAVQHSTGKQSLAYRLLNEKTDKDAAAIGATVVRPAPVSDDALFRQIVNKDKVESYLARFQNPAQKRLAAETLADIDYESFSGIAKHTQKLHQAISADATASGLDPAKDIRYLVGVDNWPNLGASSGGFISSIYREMNGLAPQKFVDFDRMYYRTAEGPAARRTYVLDDMSHSGEQIREVATDLRREYGVSGLTFSTNSALKTSTVMKYAVENNPRTGLRFLSADIKDPIAEASQATIKALRAEKGFFQAPSEELLQARARRKVYLCMTKSAESRKTLVANQLNPYVVSDRTNPITADFAKQVLNMQQWGFSKIE